MDEGVSRGKSIEENLIHPTYADEGAKKTSPDGLEGQELANVEHPSGSSDIDGLDA
jgi:hypothetical protein